jgi:hypothetical protein
MALPSFDEAINVPLSEVSEWQPPLAPTGWTRTPWGDAGVEYERLLTREHVLITVGRHEGKRWIHFSIAHPSRIPHFEELRRYKDAFLGVERKAIQVLPPKSEYVNIHPYCLHLFSCLDGDGLPDFTHGSGSL